MKFLFILLLVIACGKEKSKEEKPLRTITTNADGLTIYTVPVCKENRFCFGDCEINKTSCTQKCSGSGSSVNGYGSGFGTISSNCIDACKCAYNNCIMNTCDFLCSENPTPGSIQECRTACMGELDPVRSEFGVGCN